MTAQQERFYQEQEYGEAYQEKINELKIKYPTHNYDTLNQLAQLIYPKLFSAANGDFEDGFDLKTYVEDEPEFESAAAELAHRAKIYSLRKQVPYEQAAGIIMEVDKDLAERYKMS